MTKAEKDELIAHWDKKLKAVGFRDIESRKGDLLNVHHDTQAEDEAHAAKAGYLDGCREYYRRCARSWPVQDRRVWKLHANGLSFAEIGKELGFSKALAHKVYRRVNARYLRSQFMRKIRPPAQGDYGRKSWQVAARFGDEQAAVIKRWAIEANTTPSMLIRDIVIAAGTARRNPPGCACGHK